MFKKPPFNEIRLRIADIAISLRDDEKNLEFDIPVNYKFFISQKKPQVELRLKHDNIPEFPLKKKLFDANGVWSLYLSNRKYVLNLLSQIVILEQDFKHGNIYLKPSNGSFPLGYPLSELLMINLLSKGSGIIVHACGIKENAKGLLFIGSSGMGKSTLATLYQGKKEVTILNDDRIIVHKNQGRFWIYGTPWHGGVKLCSPEKAPIERIFFLNHAQANKMKGVERTDAASKLLVCSFPPFWSKPGMEFTLGFIDELTKEIPCYELGFLPDESVIDFVKNV